MSHDQLLKTTINKFYKGHDFLQISVSDAIRKHDGRHRVYGMITSVSHIYNMVDSVTFYCNYCKSAKDVCLEKPEFSIRQEGYQCNGCGHFRKGKNLIPTYISAVNIELQDMDSFNDIERLRVLLFGKDTKNINVGEQVIIEGEIFVLLSHGTNKGKLFTYFYGNSITYENRENIVLTIRDIIAIKKFRDKMNSNIVSKLIDMFDPSIIGYNSVKEGLLLSAVNTGTNLDNNKNNDKNKSVKKRERINVLLVGEAGLAKSRLLYSAVGIVKNSRCESAENSSGKSLTAIVSRENDTPILRLGPVPQAKYAFCALNEIGRLSFEEQKHLLSTMEEGEFTINKFGINATVKSPTTIIASANPISTEWKDSDKISQHEIPILGPLNDRFDLTFVFRKTRDKNIIREYATKKSEQEYKMTPSYQPFLVKYIEFAKKYNPKFNGEAITMLNEYFVEISSNGFGSNRVLETLYRLAKARARLKLKEFVDAEDAKETMQFYSIILEQYRQVVPITSNPRDIAYNHCISILKELNIGISIEELFTRVCNNDNQSREYLLENSKNLMLKDNRKVRSLYDMLINHKNIKIIQEKPIVLKWFKEENEKS